VPTAIDTITHAHATSAMRAYSAAVIGSYRVRRPRVPTEISSAETTSKAA
jgi:hypothetical protein